MTRKGKLRFSKLAWLLSNETRPNSGCGSRHVSSAAGRSDESRSSSGSSGSSSSSSHRTSAVGDERSSAPEVGPATRIPGTMAASATKTFDHDCADTVAKHRTPAEKTPKSVVPGLRLRRKLLLPHGGGLRSTPAGLEDGAGRCDLLSGWDWRRSPQNWGPLSACLSKNDGDDDKRA